MGRLRTFAGYVASVGVMIVGMTVAMVVITVKETGLSDDSFHAGLLPLLAGVALWGIGYGGWRGFAGGHTDDGQSGDQPFQASLPLAPRVFKVVAAFVALLGLMLAGVSVIGVAVGRVQFAADIGGGALGPFVWGWAVMWIGVAGFIRLSDRPTHDAVDRLYEKRYAFVFWAFVLILSVFMWTPRMSDTGLPEPIWQWVSWFVSSDGPLG